jgi:hypothetical protein
MNDKDDFYKYFSLSKAPLGFKKKQELFKLFQVPPKEKLMPKFYNFEKDNTHQADILYLPDDDGYKFCLVVCDIATSLMDAEPLKKIDSKTVLSAIKKIYKRGILKTPTELITDAGAEFKGEFANYFKENKIFQKNAITGRHRQVACVEKKNQILGTVLHMRMYAQELLTGEINRDWMKDLKIIIRKINEKYGHPPYDDEELTKKYGSPLNQKQQMIPLGTKVRVALDEPRDITGSKLHGKFRSSDPRYTTEIYTVINYIIDAHEPILYEIDKQTKKNERVAYTRQRLQVVDGDEEEPPSEIITNKNSSRVPKKLIGKRMYQKKLQYKVVWKGFKDSEATWEPAENLPKKMIQDYELDNLI